MTDNSFRYEITGSGVGASVALPLKKQAGILREAGAVNVREAYSRGWSNQPRTLRFSAIDDEQARLIAKKLDKANNPQGLLGGGGGLLREYGLHWAGY